MKIKLLAALLLFIAAAAARAQADDWKEFKSDKGAFSVLLPGTPKEEVQRIRTSFGDLDQHGFGVQESDGRFFCVTYEDIPKEFVAATDTDKMLDNARDVATSRTNSKLRLEKKITLGGKSAGRDAIIDAPRGIAARTRSYLVENRLYQVMAVVHKGEENGKDVEAMLDSFKLIGK